MDRVFGCGGGPGPVGHAARPLGKAETERFFEIDDSESDYWPGQLRRLVLV
jgi:hypothetical protein